MRKFTKVFGALAVAGLVVAGASAFTTSNDIDDSVAGYGSSIVSGANATAVVHTLSTDGTLIESTTLTFSATQQGRTVVAGFGVDAASTGDLQDCVVGADPWLTATCTYDPDYDTEDMDAFVVAVS